MRYFNSAIFLIAILILANFSAFAQETETVVVDEVVAQVNEGVITLSRIKREAQNAIDSLVQEGKTRDEARNLVESKKGEMIANMINEELLLQKAKELSMDAEVESEINKRLIGIMKQQNIKTLDELNKAMESQGLDPQEVRENWRSQIMRDMVFQREVDGKIFWGLTTKEIKDYYDKNRAKFTKPETLTISEIFLSFAGRNEEAVREKAKQLVAQIRGGADFAKLAIENSDRPDVAKTKGKVGSVTVAELDPKFAEPLKNVKAGGVTDPIEIVEGMEILRVDERTGASSESFFDENAVRRAIAVERIPNERQKFMAALRKEAYIKINETYRPLIAPVLFANDKPTEKAGK
ncbi:MAG TPA: peptidylprolyl isomerase [Pyrinomonadaceae bacterium]|nr:peptidylprolyl isomerase [Pyrinomonadaceae bacterium]